MLFRLLPCIRCVSHTDGCPLLKCFVQAGRTPLDLVNAEHPELAEILLMGRQLTPGRGARSRRIISPGMSRTEMSVSRRTGCLLRNSLGFRVRCHLYL